MTKKYLNELKKKLQKGDPRKLELLATDLISKLLGVRLSVAKSGFQHGSDAGTGGRVGRHLSLECKRYADNSPLDDRNLQGEIDDAIKRNSALEAWILVSTRGINQQTEDSLQIKARTTGVPVIVVDWRDDSADLPTLAALCAWAPNIVDKHYGKVSQSPAVARAAAPMVTRLRRELSPWAIGYKGLLSSSRTYLKKLWRDAAESKSVFGQNVAGGLVPLVVRESVSKGMESWWASNTKGAAVVHGAEGMGKTWSVLQWVQSRMDTLPIVLMMPSSAFKVLNGITNSSVIEFLGVALHDLNRGADKIYWQARMERLLQRPLNAGPAVLLFVDGANQEPSFDWFRFLQLMEGDSFSGRVRIVFTAQTHFLQEDLNSLRGLTNPIMKLEVGQYELSNGGEFDTLLTQHGISRSHLPPEVIELARVPRLFELTIRMRNDAAFLGAPTVERLLWAHALDELGLKSRRSLSETDWAEWLQELATRYWQDIAAGDSVEDDHTGFSRRELAEMVRDPSGSPDETNRRLHEIMSGTWLEQIPGTFGRFRPKKITIHLALGLAVIGTLDAAEQRSTQHAARMLDEYLDPIRSLPATASILTAALSVLVEKEWSPASAIPRLVLSALLQSQNATDEQRQHAVRLAPALVEPLLHVVEDSNSRANASARHWALVALRGIPALNSLAWEVIVNRMVTWVARTDFPRPEQVKSLEKSIGTAAPGLQMVLGVPLQLHTAEHDNLGTYVPQLLLGKPLIPALKVLVAAAVAAAVTYPPKSWQGLKWLVMLNSVDRAQLQVALEDASTFALVGDWETHVHPHVVQRVSNLLNFLTGDEQLEREASRRRVETPELFRYSTDYLADPALSLFAIEHRHGDIFWQSDKVSLSRKSQRGKALFPDPSMPLHESLLQEVIEWGDSFNIGGLSRGRYYTAEDHDFESILPLVARVSSQTIASIVSRWFDQLGSREGEERRWIAQRVPRFAILAMPIDVAKIREMRQRAPKNSDKQEQFVLLQLLQGELLSAPVEAQLDLVVTEQTAFISTALADAFRPPNADTVREFVHRWGLEKPRALEVICNYLWRHPTEIDDDLFQRLIQHSLTPGGEHQTLAFMALSACRCRDFGKFLVSKGWKASQPDHEFLQEAGSKAVLSASSESSLTEIADLVPAWFLLDTAVARGGLLEDLEVAAQAIEKTLRSDVFSAIPTVAQISVDSIGERNFISIEPSSEVTDADDFFFSLDADARYARLETARESGESYIRNVKSAGATMATRVVSNAAAKMLVTSCPTSVSRWLDGLEGTTKELLLRINLAGGLYLALCESLLESDPPRGAQLWQVLRRHLAISFVGVGQLNELLLMLFRAPESNSVLELRQQVYCISENANDKSYFDLVLAAISQGAIAWLEAAIVRDEQAIEPFRRRRAITLRGFLPPSSTFQPKWREGLADSSWEDLRIRAQEMQIRAHHARHWWNQFLSAPNILSALCAWQVFLVCVDQMAFVWMDSDSKRHEVDSELWRLKMLHLRFNTSALTTAIKENSNKGIDKLEKNLVGWDSPENWFAMEMLAAQAY
ncbi:ATP-binding protein [Rhodoferax saidenbachensis]|uniref:Restriction endonuclease type IV Mrr domain-containing protein n=1 Tax=Rhodoferax saidenbachensis TaxID=1484693 RepID=A0ABU1ZQW4_9BURK|nr:ATP-binding protein [Rhodoferax saidenbachensis]MDR7307939.1 hypothetical protein [Rhodoferax saidenbachensis]